MHDLRLVGVHEDGEHLMLSDAQGERFSLPVDEALRAAVRRDRARLGQLQIEIDGGLRPRDVQARIRAGASAEEVAAMAGWSVEKVRRYEGPVLAERAHVTELARAVRVRRRNAEPVALGTLVVRRLSGRGVDPERIAWDAWRPDEGPWVVVVEFAAGGRERQARWHYDSAARSVVPADDEARWLSEEDPSATGPLAGAGLAAVHGAAPGIGGGIGGDVGGTVYDIESEGGLRAEPSRAVEAGPLDLMSAMRSRRREREAGKRTSAVPGARRPAQPQPAPQVDSTGNRPSDVPGSAHPAGRKRPAREPLELNPTLMDDPPAAHPPASEVQPGPGEPDQAPLVAAAAVPRRWPLADSMARPARTRKVGNRAGPDAGAPDAADHPVEGHAGTEFEGTELEGTELEGAAAEAAEPGAGEPQMTAPAAAKAAGRPRGSQAAKRERRSSVPSWDDIMFGSKRD